MRLLVTGAGGQLGHDWCARERGDDVVGADRARIDVTDRDAVLGAITSLRPDAVVNCAAWTAVDACESDPERAFVANARGGALDRRGVRPGRCAPRARSRPTTSSTATLDRPYHEWDATNPLGVYGRSKLAGEHEALALGARAAVVRTSWVCGEHGSQHGEDDHAPGRRR